MKNTRILFSITFVCLMSLTNIFAQTENPQPRAKTGYEVILHVLTASNNTADKASVPQILSNVVKKMKNNFSFSNYRLDSTYFERIAEKGSFSSKGVLQQSASNQDNYLPIFSEWSFNDLQSLPNEVGKNSIQLRNFNFGQRVPIKNSTNGPINYEQIGLTMINLSLPENVPTVIGTLSGSKPDELTFLVLTVNSAQE